MGRSAGNAGGGNEVLRLNAPESQQGGFIGKGGRGGMGGMGGGERERVRERDGCNEEMRLDVPESRVYKRESKREREREERARAR